MAARALVAIALLAGAAGAPRLGSSQEGPYRIVRPAGQDPHPALLFVSGCSAPGPGQKRSGAFAAFGAGGGSSVVRISLARASMSEAAVSRFHWRSSFALSSNA